MRESERNCSTCQHPIEKKNKTSPHHIDVGQFIIDATKGFIFPKTVDWRHLKSQLEQTLSSRQPRNCGPSFSQLSSPCQSNFFSWKLKLTFSRKTSWMISAHRDLIPNVEDIHCPGAESTPCFCVTLELRSVLVYVTDLSVVAFHVLHLLLSPKLLLYPVCAWPISVACTETVTSKWQVLGPSIW